MAAAAHPKKPRRRAPAPTRRTTEYLPLEELVPATRNPKAHASSADINASIRRFGFVEPIVMDERTGRLVAGHGRLEELHALAGSRTADPPDGVLVDGDRWLIPVIRGWASTTDAEAEAYLLASNRLTEKGGWDDAALVAAIADLEQIDPTLLTVAGFDDTDLVAALARLEETTAEPPPPGTGVDVEAAPVYPENPISEPGDLYQLGPHLLLVGDATNPDDLTRVMGGAKASALWTDPPYGVAYRSRHHRPILGDKDPDAAVALLADALDALRKSKVLAPGAAFYVAHSDGPIAAPMRHLLNQAPFTYRQTLIWVKDALVLGRLDYQPRHEALAYGTATDADPLPLANINLELLEAVAEALPETTEAAQVRLAAGILTALQHYPIDHAAIGYGHVTGGGRRGRLAKGVSGWTGGHAETTVFQIPKPRSSRLHPTMKPLDLVTRTLGNSVRRGQHVLDFMAGSGTTMLAAAQLGLIAHLLELDPGYADVIARRWTHVTGEPAICNGKPRRLPPLTPQEATP